MNRLDSLYGYMGLPTSRNLQSWVTFIEKLFGGPFREEGKKGGPDVVES